MPLYEYKQRAVDNHIILSKEKGICETVWIDAKDATAANKKAEEIGIFFGGMNTRDDPPAGGDRWSRVLDHEYTKEKTTIDIFSYFENGGSFLFLHMGGVKFFYTKEEFDKMRMQEAKSISMMKLLRKGNQ